MSGSDPLSRSHSGERLLGIAKLIESIFRETASALGYVATEPVDEVPTLRDKVSGINPVTVGSLHSISETSNHEEGRIALPVDEARDRRGTDACFSGESGHAFERKAVRVSHHVGEPVDGRSEDLGVGCFSHAPI